MDLRRHLRGPDGRLVVDDLQRALDPCVSVRVAFGWTVEVKDHHPARLRCQLQEVPQAAHRLLPRPQPLVGPQRAARPERIALDANNTSISNQSSDTAGSKQTVSPSAGRIVAGWTINLVIKDLSI